MIICGFFLSFSGCVQRRLLIRSNPPGAMVYVDDYPIGITPVSTDFIYYGTRKFRLVKDGYQTLTQLRRVGTPWYQVPPLDFVSENVVPWEIRDERVVDFQLEPAAVVPSEHLLQRGEQLRQSSRGQGMIPVAPGGPLAPPFPGPR